MSLRFLVAAAIICVLTVSDASGQDVQIQYPRCTEVSFNPILKTVGGNPRLHAYYGWHNPATEVLVYMNGMRIGSNLMVNERLTLYHEMDFFPVKADGFQYTEEHYLSGQWHMPDGVDYIVFDTAVNSGPGRAIRFLQGCVGVEMDGAFGPRTMAAVKAADPKKLVEDYALRRLSFLQDLPTWSTFGRGWARRVAEVQNTASTMSA